MGYRAGGGDTALIVLVGGHLNVTLLSPGGALRVLDKPLVVDAFLGPVAHDEHSVVQKLPCALGFIIGVVLVVLKTIVGVDFNRDRPNGGNGFLQFVLIARVDLDISGARGTDVALIPEVAGAVLSDVRIALLGVETAVRFNVFRRPRRWRHTNRTRGIRDQQLAVVSHCNLV